MDSAFRCDPMRRTLAITALFISATTARAQTGIDLSQARAYFTELSQLDSIDGGKLWGRRVAGPMMFADPASRTVVANQADAKGLLRLENGLWIGKLPPEISVANTAQNVGGRIFSMIIWPLTDSKYARGRLLMHESFHRIQDSLALPAFNPGNAHMVSAESRIWTRLEWRALTEALLHTGAARKQALTDALTFRARRSSSAPAAKEEERQLELNEGLAEYTGLVLSGLPKSALHDRVAVQLAQAESGESFSRSFAYASGPAYGLLLDDTGHAWRKRLSSSSDISTLAQNAYGITALDSRNADKLVSRYIGERMVADERAKETKRLARENQLRAMFTSGARLTLPNAGAFSFSFNPNAVLPIQSLGTVYEGARITDAWGILDADNGTVLITRDGAGNPGSAIVAHPTIDGGTVKGDGWKLELSPGWSLEQGPGGAFAVVKKN
jgi:hypothetical protein